MSADQINPRSSASNRLLTIVRSRKIIALLLFLQTCHAVYNGWVAALRCQFGRNISLPPLVANAYDETEIALLHLSLVVLGPVAGDGQHRRCALLLAIGGLAAH